MLVEPVVGVSEDVISDVITTVGVVSVSSLMLIVVSLYVYSVSFASLSDLASHLYITSPTSLSLVCKILVYPLSGFIAFDNPVM